MRYRPVSLLASRVPIVPLTGGVLVAIGIVVWLGYGATREWQRSSMLLVERRAEERTETLVRALTRDMQAVQASVLARRHWNDGPAGSLNELTDLIAVTFARYPYPEAFFGWPQGVDQARLFLYRADRPPHWVPETDATDLYPVVLVRDPQVAAALAGRIADDVAERRDYALFETALDGVPYQVVARILYKDSLREHAQGVFGFVVNLDWVRRIYFRELNAELATVGDTAVGLDVEVLTEQGRRIVASAGVARPPGTARSFPLLFFDPQLVMLGGSADLPRRMWTVRVSAGSDPTLLASTKAGDWTFVIIATAAAALVIGLVLTGSAARADAALTEMRSDFVAAVTHELKAPLATIRTVGDTLAKGRVTQGDVMKHYSQVLVQEARRLTRLVDNLLAYARVTDVTGIYTFEPQVAAELVDEALHGFRHQLSEADFELHVDVPVDLPLVRADRTAINLLLDNLIDNALRYSGRQRWLGVTAWATPRGVTIEVKDHGQGISADELLQVQSKFYRGRRTPREGNGLGLAIAKRIAADHGAPFHLDSRVGEGTTVALTLPAIREVAHAVAG